jgi:hypothetical protein
MKCLAEDCTNEIENKTGRRKFCSNVCKMRHFRKHGNKGDIKLYQMQNLYNQMMEVWSELKKNKSDLPKGFTDFSKVGVINQDGGVDVFKSEFDFLNEISELQFEDEYRKKAIEIKNASHLSEKTRERLLLNMKQSKL